MDSEREVKDRGWDLPVRCDLIVRDAEGRKRRITVGPLTPEAIRTSGADLGGEVWVVLYPE